MTHLEEKTENKKKMMLVTTVGIISMVAMLSLLIVVAMYAHVMTMASKVVLLTIAFITFVVGIYVASRGECTTGYYECKKCKERFVPSFKDYFFGAHTLTKRWLKCPACGEKTWAKKVMTKTEFDKSEQPLDKN